MKQAGSQKKSDYIPILYGAIMLAVVLPWFISPGFLFLTDFVWGPHLRLDWQEGPLLLNVAIIFLNVAFSADTIQKLCVAGALLSVLLGGRKIASRFLKDKAVMLLVALFAMFNPFVYDRLGYGQIWMIASLGFLLLAVGYLLEYFERRNLGAAIWFAVWSGLCIQFAHHYIFFCGVLIVPFLTAILTDKDNRRFRRIAAHVAIVATIVLILNANWLVSTFSAGGGKRTDVSRIEHQDLLAFQTSGDSGRQVLRNVLLMSGFWGKDQYRYVDLSQADPAWGRSFCILLPLLIWGAYAGLRRKEGRTLCIGLLTVGALSAVLAVGIRLPVGRELTYWLFDHLPFYKGLRETQKWVAVLAVVYAVFLSLGLRELFRLHFVQTNRLMSSIFVAAVIVMQAPLLLWGMGGQVWATPYPKDWSEVDRRIVEETGCDGRTVFLPWHLYMSFSWTKRIVATPAQTFFSCPTMVSHGVEWGGMQNSGGSEESILVERWLANKGDADLLDNQELDIRFIIVAKELEWRTLSWMDDFPELELVMDTESLRLYRVK